MSTRSGFPTPQTLYKPQPPPQKYPYPWKGYRFALGKGKGRYEKTHGLPMPITNMIDDHPPAKPLAVDSEPEVQLFDQSDLETDDGAVDDEDNSILNGPKDLSELL